MEIIFMAILYSVLRKKLVKKGRPTGLAWLGPALWIGGEFAGAFIGAFIVISRNPRAQIGIFDIYPYALPGAVLGAIVAYLVVSSQPVQSHDCPSCGEEFMPKINPQGRSRCPHCGAILRIIGGMVHVVRLGKTS